MNALVPINNADLYRASTDAADMCKEIVLASAMEIQKRKYVKVEGWQAIAVAHGCTGSARGVERVEGGVRAIGEVRRMSDGQVIAEAEGFVGEDEPTWYGGEVEKDEWVNNRKTGRKIKTILPRRADYAIRAMAQTRAISRACRSAFAHVVVMMNAGLSTTPAEEVPRDGFDDMRNVTPARDDSRDPPRQPLWMVAAKTAIDICNTVAECNGWHGKNAEMLEGQPAAEADEIIRYLKARVLAVKPLPPKNGNGHTNGVALPQDDEAARFPGDRANGVARNGSGGAADQFADLADEIPF